MESKSDEITTHYYGITICQLIAYVLGSPGRPVHDSTGLVGKYDLTTRKPAVVIPPPGSAPRENVTSDPGTSPASLAEQLGLKLQATRGTIETLVIDHIERPSEN